MAACLVPVRGWAEPIAGVPQESGDAFTTLFARLKSAPDAAKAQKIAESIIVLWMKSGSPSIDLLMNRGMAALEADDIDRAYFYFNEVVSLMPDFAEGWNQRGYVYARQKKYAASLKDLEHALRLAPRNFMAMANMAYILEVLGDKKGAEDLMARAHAINPWLERRLKRHVEKQHVDPPGEHDERI